MRRIILPLLLGSLCSCGGGSADQEQLAPPPSAVTADTAQIGDVPITVKTLGTLSASQTVLIQPKVGGTLEALHFSPGDTITTGDPLLTLDKTQLKLQLEEAEANLARTQASLAHAKQRLDRIDQLAARAAVTEAEREGLVKEVDLYVASLAADQSRLDGAQLQLSYASIAAPINGVIGRSTVDPGNSINPGATIATLWQLDPIIVEFSLPESALTRAEGTMTVTLSDLGVGGEVDFVDWEVDRKTGTIAARAHISNTEHKLRPGQRMPISVHLATEKNSVLVPASTAQLGADGYFAYVLNEEGLTERRDIEVGLILGDRIVIRSGVHAGERVITDGQMKIGPGMPVKVLNDEESAG